LPRGDLIEMGFGRKRLKEKNKLFNTLTIIVYIVKFPPPKSQYYLLISEYIQVYINILSYGFITILLQLELGYF